MNKQFSTMQKLNEVHSKLKAKFKEESSSIKEAKELEEFFNYLLYNKNSDNKNNPFIQGIDNETKNLILNSPYVQRLKLREGESAQSLGKYGEEGMSYLLLEAVASVSNSEEFKTLLKNNADKMIKQMIMGDVKAATLTENVAEQIANKANEAGDKALRNLKKNYGVYAFRQGKIDIDTSRLSLNITLSEKAKKLLNLSASVKNYKSAYIHLETVNRKKAYQGIMANLYPQLSGEATSEIYDYYYKKLNGNNPSKKMEEHFLHIVNLYALTGIGQSYIEKEQIDNIAKYSLIESNLGAKFLIANIAENQEVIVVPSSEIALGLHDSRYGELFSYNGKVSWRNQANIPVILNLNKYKKIRK